MEQRRLNRAALAELTGLSRAAITYFLKGERQPSRPVLAELADKLNVTVDFLLGLPEKRENADAEDTHHVHELVDLYMALSTEDQQRCLELIKEMKASETTAQKDTSKGSTDKEPLEEK